MKKFTLLISLVLTCFLCLGQGGSILNLDGDLPLSSIETYLNQTELVPRTIYVDSLNGNDVDGCGTELEPFQSIKRAVEDIKFYIAADITIQIDSFANEFNFSEISALTRLLTLTNGASLIFKGTTKTYASGVALVQDPNLSNLYTFSGATFSENEIRGMYIIKNTNNHYAVSQNRNDSLWICDVTTAGTRDIYENKTTIINSESLNTWLELPIGNIIGGSIQFENINFDDVNRWRYLVGGVKIYFHRCNFDWPFDFDIIGVPPTYPTRVDYKECYFGVSTSLESRIRTNRGGHITIRDCVFNQLSGATEAGLSISTCYTTDLANTMFNGCGLTLISGSILKFQKAVIFKDVSIAMSIESKNEIFGNEINAELILDGVTNLFSYGPGNQFDEIVTGGFIDVEGSYTNLFAEISGYQSLEQYIINLPGLWQKNERIITDITNNTSGNIDIADTLQNKAVYIDYSITRNTQTEIGTIYLSGRNDATIDDNINATFDDAGITFNKNVSGSTVRIGYTLSDATYDAELNLVIRRSYN